MQSNWLLKASGVVFGCNETLQTYRISQQLVRGEAQKNQISVTAAFHV